MANLRLSHIYKVYPNGVKAVNDFSLDIKDGEFIVFVGPSGCGKSTTLRMIAGLEDITAGDLFIGEKLMNYEEPKDRNIAFVFQNYALYPHMTIYENLAFGLKNQKIWDKKKDKDGNVVLGVDKKKLFSLKKQLLLSKLKRDERAVLRLERQIEEVKNTVGPIEIRRHYTKKEIEEKIKYSSKILDISEYLARKPKEMSGGQRQRVALGRALVRDPEAFLLDEPLSNLDAKLRGQMRTEITKLHQEVKKTFIYVTHDQVEAMTMGDRIVVMKNGFIQQIDTPMNLYDHPKNKFVAGFIGTPQMNFFPVTLKKDDENVMVRMNEASFTLPYSLLDSLPSSYLSGDKEVTLGIRGEHINIVKEGIPFKVSVVEKLGDETIVYGDIILENCSYPCTIKTNGNHSYQLGEMIHIAFEAEKIHLFDKNENSLLCSIRDSYEVEGVIENGVLLLWNERIKLPTSITSRLENGKTVIQIPNDALINGSSIHIDKEEEKVIDDVTYIRINKDGYHFYFKKSGEYTTGDFDFKKLTFIQNENAVIKPLDKEISITGKIIKEKNGGYSFEFFSKKVPAYMDAVRKAALVDGYDCHKKEYEFIIPVSSISLEKEGLFQGKVNAVLDYGKEKHMEIAFEEMTFHLPYQDGLKEGNVVSFNLSFDSLALYRKEDHVRIF